MNLKCTLFYSLILQLELLIRHSLAVLLFYLIIVSDSKAGKVKRYTWSSASIELFFEGLLQVIYDMYVK